MDFKKILKETLVLLVICLISGLLLGLTYEITSPIIAERQSEQKAVSFASVFPDCSFAEDTELTNKLADAPDLITKAGISGVTIDEILAVSDSSDTLIGYAMTITTNGNQGAIVMGYGFLLDGTTVGIDILESSETAGLGSKADDADFKDQFAGKLTESFTYTKNGASSENEIDVISGATETTKAVVEAVNAGIVFGNYCAGNE